MKYFFCPVADNNGTTMALNTGAKFVKESKSKWIALPDKIS